MILAGLAVGELGDYDDNEGNDDEEHPEDFQDVTFP
jgi:hypothetical protein